MTGELKWDRRQELLRSTRSEPAPPSRAPASRKLLDREEEGAVTEVEVEGGRARLAEAEEVEPLLLLLSPDLRRLLMLREVPLLLPPASPPPPLPEPEMGRILRKLEAGLAPPPPPPSSSLLRPLLRPWPDLRKVEPSISPGRLKEPEPPPGRHDITRLLCAITRL